MTTTPVRSPEEWEEPEAFNAAFVGMALSTCVKIGPDDTMAASESGSASLFFLLARTDSASLLLLEQDGIMDAQLEFSHRRVRQCR